jgi:hypothetical protein
VASRRISVELLLALAALFASACQFSTPAETPSGGGAGGNVIPVATSKGIPQGFPVSSVMGATGGALADVTGDVQLSVPSGSAAPGTVFTITPISSRAAGALGTSFRIDASRPLQGPVHVSFRGLGYYGAGLGVSALGIRFQDSRGFWLPPDAIARDAATDTVTATTTHLSDWTLVLDDPPDMTGTFTLTQAIGIPFTATGTAALYALPVTSLDPGFLLAGTITIPPSIAYGNSTCVPDGQTKNLDLSVAEIHGAGFRWGINGLWNLTCTDSITGAVTQQLLPTTFDTLGINFVRCNGQFNGTQVNGSSFIQGKYTTDCSATGTVSATWDFRGCSPGGTCQPVNLCQVGTVTCTGGVGECTVTGNQPAGTSCGTGRTCDGSGTCI